MALCAGATAATLNGSTTLDSNSPQFRRPSANCGAGVNLFKFTAVDFEVDTSSTYTINAPENAQVADPWLQLYSSPFAASLPLVNCIIGDDDSGGGPNGLSARIANQPLTAGSIYTAIITTFNAAQVGTINWSMTGAGNFTRRNGFVDATGTPNLAAGDIALAIRLSSNGVDTTDDLYWVAVTPGSPPPNFTQVLSGEDGSSAAAAFSGSFAATGLNANQTRTISGLAANTIYDVYLALGNGSNPGTSSFTNGTVRALDFTPDTPVFTPTSNAAFSTPAISAAVVLTGFTEVLPISITGGEYSLNNGAFTSVAGTAQPGQNVRIRQTSAAVGSTTTTATLTLGTVSAAFDVTTMAPIPGACGAAAGVASAFRPAANLCLAGAQSAVTGSSSGWAWSCASTTGSTTASCSAPLDSTATGTGSGSAAVSGSTWGVDAAASAGFIAASADPSGKSPPDLPPGVVFPHGLFDFVLTGGAAGSTATITITFPNNLPAGVTYWKYGPSPAGFNCTGAACNAPHWYQMPSNQVSIAGNVLTLTITDGGVGDDDLAANGVIVDVGGPGVLATTEPIPTLSQWAMALFGLLMAAAAWVRLRPGTGR